MARLDKNSFSEAIIPALDIFATPPTQSSIERIDFQDFRPTSQLTQDSPIDFNISNGGFSYTDLSRCRLYLKGKITKAGGGALAATDIVAPVNNLLDSLFSQIDLTIGGKLASISCNTYGYKAYLQCLMKYGHSAKNSGQLAARLWSTDRGSDLDATKPKSAPLENSGLVRRWNLTKENVEFDMEGTLCEDLFRITKYIINSVDINIKLYPNRPEFYLMHSISNGKFQFQITEAIFRACRVTVTAAILIAHNQALSKAPAVYSYKRTYVKVNTISQGHYNYVADNVYNGYSPTFMMVALTQATAAAGNYERNPFNFGMHNLSNIALFIDGRPTPGQALAQGAKTYVRSYNDLFYSSGRWDGDVDIDVTREEFANGNAIYAFQIEPVNSDGYLSLLKSANCRLELTFSVATENALALVLYGEFQGLMDIDRARSVSITSNG
jgi:hypothetical protein